MLGVFEGVWFQHLWRGMTKGRNWSVFCVSCMRRDMEEVCVFCVSVEARDVTIMRREVLALRGYET